MHEELLELIPWLKGFCYAKADKKSGELSIVDDMVQEACLYAMERPNAKRDLKIVLMRGAENFLDRHRERKNKGKMWQNGFDEYQESRLWGDNPDFD